MFCLLVDTTSAFDVAHIASTLRTRIAGVPGFNFAKGFELLPFPFLGDHLCRGEDTS
jgi:hypothetical protein